MYCTYPYNHHSSHLHTTTCTPHLISWTVIYEWVVSQFLSWEGRQGTVDILSKTACFQGSSIVQPSMSLPVKLNGSGYMQTSSLNMEIIQNLYIEEIMERWGCHLQHERTVLKQLPQCWGWGQLPNYSLSWELPSGVCDTHNQGF